MIAPNKRDRYLLRLKKELIAVGLFWLSPSAQEEPINLRREHASSMGMTPGC